MIAEIEKDRISLFPGTNSRLNELELLNFVKVVGIAATDAVRQRAPKVKKT